MHYLKVGRCHLVNIIAALLVMLCCLPAFQVHAQNASPVLLHQILHELGQHTAVRASFVQQRQNPALTQIQTSRGQLLFVAQQGMLWQVQHPYAQTLAFTAHHTQRIDAQGHMLPMRNERGMSQISQMLQSLLKGQLDTVERQFHISAQGSPTQWCLRFTPKQARVEHILRSIDLSGGNFLTGIRIEMQDGTQTDIRMHDTRDAAALSTLEKNALGLP